MTLDPITLEILSTKVTAVAEEMGLTLQRTGRTLYVKETADFGTALVALDGKIFAYPRAIGVSGFIDIDCSTGIRAVGKLAPGDVIITNHPYASMGLSTHTPDVHLIRPYFHDGELVAYGWTFVHSSDVGGRVPSSISPRSAEIFEEGLMLPPVKLMQEGIFNDAVLQIFRANSRTPDENVGDLKAQLAALTVGARRVAGVIAQHGQDAFLACQSDLRAYSRAKARAVFRTIPDGAYSFADYLDDDLVLPFPVRIKVTILVRDGQVTLDFTGTDLQVLSAYNIPTLGTRHPWLSLRLVALVLTLDPSVPLNCGLFDDIVIMAPQGTLLNPRFPAATGVRHASAIRVNDVLNGALAAALPQVMTACNGGVVIPVVLAEEDAETGARNVIVVEPMIGGMGARYGADGVDGRDSSIANLANNPLETVEIGAATMIMEYGLRPDSGGPGRWRGGVGTVITFTVTKGGSTVLGRGMERFEFQPWGLLGGHPGAKARTLLNPGTPDERELGKIDMVNMRQGDVLSIMTPGGGGYGDPLERDPALVVRDVARGLVSAERARYAYGVVLDGDGFDALATAQARSVLSGDRAPDLYAFDPNRAAWETVFDDATMTALTRAMLAQPIGMQRTVRSRYFHQILGALAEETPLPFADIVRQVADLRSRAADLLADFG